MAVFEMQVVEECRASATIDFELSCVGETQFRPNEAELHLVERTIKVSAKIQSTLYPWTSMLR